MQKRTKKSRIIYATFIIVILMFMFIPSAVLAAAGDETAAGTVSLVPTVECIGVVATYTNDNNGNNSAVLQYRQNGSGNWITGMDMYADRTRKEYRASVLGLSTNTPYEVRVTFSDADSVTGSNPLSSAITTMNANPPLGTVHTYYVSTSGSDSSGDGSINKPWRTIQKAANTVVAGDTVYIRAGTYNEKVTITADGNANNFISFLPYSGEGVTVDGATGSQSSVFVLNDANYIRIKGLNIQNSYSNSAVLVENSEYSIIEYNIIINPARTPSDSLQGGIDFKNTSHSIAQYNTISVSISSSVAHGIICEGVGNGMVIRYNTISGSSQVLRDGISCSPEDSNGIKNADIYNNSFMNCNDDDIQVDGNGTNVRVWNNKCLSTSNYSSISIAPISTGPCYIFRNIMLKKFKMEGSGGRIYVYHNTLNSDGGFVGNGSGKLTNVISRNNIGLFAGNSFHFDNIVCSNSSYDYDDFFTRGTNYGKWNGTDYSTFASFKSGSGQENHGFNNPDHKFTNIEGRDYTLQNGSPDIDIGIIIPGFNDANSTWPYKGSAPDIGAYEYGGTYTPPAQPPSNGGTGGGEGGGGIGASGSSGGGITSLRYSISSKCIMMEDISATDVNMKVTLNILKNTIVKNKNNQPPISIRIEEIKESLPVDSNMQLIGKAYEIGQSKITFDPAATLVFKYFSSELPIGIPATNLFIGLWDPDVKSWQDVGGTVDTSTRSVSTNITHLSTYALMAHTQPAEFSISGIALTLKEVFPGEPVTANVIVNNTGDLSGNYTAILKMDNIAIQTKDITLSGGASEIVSFDIVQYNAGEHWINVGEMLATLIVKSPLSPAIFTVGELSTTPPSLEVGENIIINVPVQNTGDVSGTFRAMLVVDNNLIDTKEIVLDSDGSATLEFNYTPDSAGTHTANIGDKVVTFEVMDKEAVNPTQAGVNEAKLDIDNSSITPNYSPTTDKLVYASIVYKIDQPLESLTGYNLLLFVTRDDQLIEQIPLMNLSQLQEDGQTGELDYVPAAGWTVGKYTFQIDLYHGDKLIQTAEFLPLEVESKSTTLGISWMNLGAIIGSVFFLGIVAITVLLYFKRKNFRYYWK